MLPYIQNRGPGSTTRRTCSCLTLAAAEYGQVCTPAQACPPWMYTQSCISYQHHLNGTNVEAAQGL